jgi:DNA-binding response OmpR family regulator
MSRKIQILLIEDDADDVELLQEALTDNGVDFQMTVIKDGNAAVNHFKEGGPLPDIVVMDFNLPKVHGRDVVREIRSNDRYKRVPVLILSTSSSATDINFAYEAGANNYLVKPATLEAINSTVTVIVDLASRSPTNQMAS